MFKKKYYTNNDLSSLAEETERSVRQFQYKQDNFYVRDDAVILPMNIYPTTVETARSFIYEGGVCDENFNFIDGYFLKKDSHDPLTVECVSSYVPDNIKSINETVIFAGYLARPFGLAITDSLTRLWYPIINKDKKQKIAFMVRDGFNPFKLFHMKLLGLLGIDEEQIIIITEPTKFKRVIIPKQAVFWLDGYDTELFLLPYDAARNSVVPKKFKKIYLSRSKYENHDMFNEEFFEKFFTSQGYEVIYPEQLELEEQIAYLAGAEEIACTYGTLSHMLLFSRPNTKCIFLLRSSTLTYDFTRQYIVNQSKDLNYVFVDVSLNLLPATHDTYSGYIVGPSCNWQTFIKNELGINVEIDIFDYLNKLNLRLGDYVKLYLEKAKKSYVLQETFEYRFNYAYYLKSLFSAFEQDGCEDMLNAMKTPGNPTFSNKVFKCTGINSGDGCIIKFCINGSIKMLEGHLGQDVMYWAYFRHRLILLNRKYSPVMEFDIKNFTKRIAPGGGKIFQGCSLSGDYISYRLLSVSNAIPRIIIKFLVNNKKYKKLKRNPEDFFNDSKSSVIRFISRFYYY